MRSTEHSELLIESEAHSTESLQVQSAKSWSNVAPNAQRHPQADVNLGQGFYWCVHNSTNNGADVK